MEQLISEVKARFFQANGYELDNRDWARLAFAGKLTVGPNVLDVGCSAGFLLHLLADSNMFNSLYGLDIVKHSKWLPHQKVSYLYGDIRDEQLKLPVVDTVVCMEVIEHLEDDCNLIVLNNLRKATYQRLIVSLPFEEPEPLWWHDKPGGHRQSFNMAKVQNLFSNAVATIIPRYGVDWLLIVEDRSCWSSPLQILSNNDMLNALSC